MNGMKRIRDVADYLSAHDVRGDKDALVTLTALDGITEDALVCVHDSKRKDEVLASPARALVVKEALETEKIQIVVANVKKAFVQLLSFFHPEDVPVASVAESASVAEDVVIGKGVFVGPSCVLEEGVVLEDGVILRGGVFVGKGARIGKGTRIEANVTIYRACVIGEACIIHAGTVIGSDGFGYEEVDGVRVKIPQCGNVVIGKNVEIGASVAIDRATLGSTRIGDGVKIDNLVHIAHNCVIGENTLLIAQVGIAGSSTIGKNCILAGQVGIADHVVVEDNVVIAAKGGVSSHSVIKGNQFLWGAPVQSMKREKLSKLGYMKLPDVIAFLEKKFDTKFRIPRA